MEHVPVNGPVRFLNVREAAELLRVSPRSVYQWVSEGSIPHRKAGRRLIEFTTPDLGRRQPAGFSSSRDQNISHEY